MALLITVEMETRCLDTLLVFLQPPQVGGFPGKHFESVIVVVDLQAAQTELVGR